jgi:Sodium:dicarboxylate symporter family
MSDLRDKGPERIRFPGSANGPISWHDPRTVPLGVLDGKLRSCLPEIAGAARTFWRLQPYCTFATIFIAQAYNIHLPLPTEIVMLLLLMVTSKGMAGVPRASLVVLAATLMTFNIPEAGRSRVTLNIPTSDGSSPGCQAEKPSIFR